MLNFTHHVEVVTVLFPGAVGDVHLDVARPHGFAEEDLGEPEVWAGASIHMATTIVVFGLGVFGLGLVGLPFFTDLNVPLVILVAFARFLAAPGPG